MATSRTTSKLLINEYPLQVLPSLACAIGLNEALILQQVHYWLQLPSAHEHDGRRWIYNSYPSWQKQFPFWSVNTVRRAIESLEDKGYLISGNYNKRAMDKTKWYTLDYDALDKLPLTEWLDPFGNNARPSAQNGQTISSDWADHDANLGRPIPETNTETNNRERSSVATPQARKPRAAKRDMGRDIPPADPDYDYKALWAAIEAHTERKLLWNFAAETQAVKRIVRAYPGVTPEELIGFLAYLETVFPWSQDPTRQVTFSEGAKHFAKWYSGDQPVALVTKGSSNGRTYESPGERKEREWMESIASIYGSGSPAGDHRGATEHEPPALPARTPQTRIISLDGRRVG